MLVHPASNGDDEKGKWIENRCIAAGHHAEGTASSLPMISMTSILCRYDLQPPRSLGIEEGFSRRLT